MTESPEKNAAPEIPGGLAEAYWERYILAGFLSPEELPRLYPETGSWPPELAARVTSLHEASARLAQRPEAGQASLLPVGETEARSVLHPIAQTIRFGAETPIGFAWVDLANLITPSAVSGPLPYPVEISGSDPHELALFSLFVFGPPPAVVPQAGLLVSSVPLEVSLKGAALRENQLLVQYEINHPLRPIIVGYEQGRCYLLSGSGRVLHALSQGVKRLLCIVHYGLDLSAPYLGVKLPWLQGPPINHFGPERLSGVVGPPMVHDFLDPALAAIVPTRAGFFAVKTSVTPFGLNV